MELTRIFATAFAALFGLAYGSFLNVCLSRWPYGESIIKPRSHCRNCTHTLSWWENLPLLSWLILRGRCRKCHTKISWRYPLVEFLVAALWASVLWNHTHFSNSLSLTAEFIFATMMFYWLLVALAFLDAEHFWLPDLLTMNGIILGLIHFFYLTFHAAYSSMYVQLLWFAFARRLLECAIGAAIILIIRWLYWLLRRKEGMGLGDAKLMAMLAAWLGLPGALLSMFIAVTLGATYAVLLLINERKAPLANDSTSEEEQQDPTSSWHLTHLPLGTFLCIGGAISSFCGDRIIAAYLHWAGF